MDIISKYIHDYLNEGNTSVVVPDLGCFTIVTKPSVIQNNIGNPPVKSVEFDGENTDDDNVFTRYVAEKGNMTIKQATDEIYTFYNHYFILKLANSKVPIFCENFGTFSKDETGNIKFEPVADFLKDNYGLDQVQITADPKSPFEATFVAPEPVAPPTPEPTKPEESEPVQSPSDTDQPVQETKESDDSLFSDNKNYRENKERRRSADEKQEPPSRPTKPSKTLKPSKTSKPPKTAPKPKKQPRAKKTGDSNLWVLWVFLSAAGLGVAGYYLYPKINESFTKGRPVTLIAEKETEPAYTVETDEDTPNNEIAQTLDEATDKKNALNPSGSQQTEVATSQQPSGQESVSSTPVAEPKQASVTQSQSNAGSGKFVVISGSFFTRSDAEKHGKKLQNDGFADAYEIIDAIVEGNHRYRVSIANYDSLDEATQYANQMKSKLNGEIWVTRR